VGGDEERFTRYSQGAMSPEAMEETALCAIDRLNETLPFYNRKRLSDA